MDQRKNDHQRVSLAMSRSQKTTRPDSIPGNEMPEILARALRESRVQRLDARPLLQAGKEPLGAIMEAVKRLGPDEAFELTTPFEPVPLYGVLGGKGFEHWKNGDGAEGVFRTYFFRENAEEAVAENRAEGDFSDASGEGEIREIDVRGLEAPEPLERVMEAVESMAYGDVVRVKHHREPLILFDVLAERGFVHRSKQLGPEEWEIRIWRKS